MNTRFNFKLIRHLHQGRQGGFALPMAIMLGIVALVIGATILIRAQGDQTNVVSKTASDQAMAATEAGATQYMNFLNSNRGLIPYPSCAGSLSADGSCSDTTTSTTTKSWITASAASGNLNGIGTTQPVSISGETSCSSSAGGSGTPPSNYQTVSSSTISTNWANSSNTSGWKSLPQGKYRLISYVPSYTNSGDVKTVNSAKLTIEGQSSIGGGSGKARVEFTIPVTASTVPASGSTTTSNNFPGLWAQNFDFGNNTSANAQVWDSSNCGTSATAMPDARILDYTSQDINVFPSSPLTLASGVTDTAKANNGNKQLYSGTVYRTSSSAPNPLPKVMKSQAFPSLPNGGTFPTSSNPALVYGPGTTQTGTVTENSLDCSSLSNVTFPRASGEGGATTADKSSTNVAYSGNSNDAGTYVYRCTGGMSIGGNDVTLGRTGKETLVFYVNGTFNASANGGVFPVQGTNTWSRGIFYVKNDAQVKANGNVGRLLAPDSLQFYVYNSDNKNPGFDMGGNGSLYAFVFAPTSVGLSKGTEDLGGALWIKSYEVDGNNKVWQAIFDDSKLMVDLPDSGDITTYNLGGTPSNWTRKPIN